MLAQISLAIAVPGVFIAHAVVLGCEKAGCSPFSKSWWTS